MKHYDNEGGIIREWTYLPDGKVEVKSTQDVEPILKRNREYQASKNGYTPSRDLKWVASIPLIIAEKWKKEEGIDIFNKNHREAIRKKLNDPEYSYLRTGGGKLKVY